MSDKDKFADALHAMNAGETDDTHDPAEDEVLDDGTTEEAPTPPPPTAAAPAAPQAVARSKPAVAPVSEPPAVRPSRPSAPAARPAAKALEPAPTAPSTPAAPTRAARPSAPPASRKPVAVPMPSPTSTSATPVDYAPAQARKPMAVGTLNFRRTLIPPCLVLGVSCLILTALYFMQPAESALGQISKIVPIGLSIAGVVVLAAGVFNMLLVKHELSRKVVVPKK